MKVLIRFNAKQEARALPIILRCAPGMVLKDRTYLLSEETVEKIKKAGIRFIEIGREGEATIPEGVTSGREVQYLKSP